MDDLSIEKIKSVYELIKSLDPSAYPLIFGMLFPVIYVLLVRLLSLDKSDPAAPAPARENLSANWFGEWMSGGMIKNIIDAFAIGYIKLNKWVFGVSIITFIIGIFTLSIHQRRVEAARINGLELKKAMIQYGYTHWKVSEAQSRYHIDTGQLRKYFSSDFVQIYDPVDSDFSIVLVDSVAKPRIDSFCIKLLDNYLESNYVTGDVISFDTLFNKCDYFLREYIRALIIKKPQRYGYLTSSDKSVHREFISIRTNKYETMIISYLHSKNIKAATNDLLRCCLPLTLTNDEIADICSKSEKLQYVKNFSGQEIKCSCDPSKVIKDKEGVQFR